MRKQNTLPAICLFFLLSGCFIPQQTSILPGPTPDTMAPYINMRQYEFSTEVDHPIDFSNIGGYDDVDGLLPTRLRGYVDYTKEGDYYPSIVCRDLSGNESEVIITIHVLPAGTLTSVEESVSTPEPTPSGCQAENALDPDLPCLVVPASVIEPYRILFEGEEGKDQCIARFDEEACEVIVRNDGSFWGYGVK
jgi:hypothetical protein